MKPMENIAMSHPQMIGRPSPAFIGASWFALLVGMAGYLVGLWNAEMQLNEKGYYFTVLMYGLFSAVSVQKAVRDRLEDIPVTNIYYGLSWFSTILSITLLVIGLWNAEMTMAEKGFYAIAFMMSLFASIAVQKNTRDAAVADTAEGYSRRFPPKLPGEG
jgi:uncharacterized membrane protein YiaA